MPRSAIPLRLQLAALLFASGTALATTQAAASPDAGVDALSRLSAADLDTTRPAGRAFLRTLFPNPAKTCGKPDTEHLPFDNLCNWWANPDSEEVYPDLMVAMNKSRIVSVVTVEPSRLNAGTWTCEKAAQGQATVCFAKTIDAATGRRWSQAWHAYLSSVN